MPRLSRFQRHVSIQLPDRIPRLLGKGLHHQIFCRVEGRSGHHNVEVGQHPQGTFSGDRRGSVGVVQAQAKGSQGGEPKGQQAIVATQKREVVSAPEVIQVISGGIVGRDISHIQQPQGGGIFKQKTLHIGILQNAPGAPGLIEVAIARLANVKTLGIAADVEGLATGNHVALEVVIVDPFPDRALPQRRHNLSPAAADRRQAAFGLTGLALDRLHPTQLI